MEDRTAALDKHRDRAQELLSTSRFLGSLIRSLQLFGGYTALAAALGGGLVAAEVFSVDFLIWAGVLGVLVFIFTLLTLENIRRHEFRLVLYDVIQHEKTYEDLLKIMRQERDQYREELLSARTERHAMQTVTALILSNQGIKGNADFEGVEQDD